MSQTGQPKQRTVQRQNSFLSPITSTTFTNRRLSSSRSSLLRSPDGTESSRDRKRKRLSLLPANAHLGAPRLINPPNLRRQSIMNNNNNNNNSHNHNHNGNISSIPSLNSALQAQLASNSTSSTPFTIRNAATQNTVQQLVQNSITRSGIPLNTQRRSTIGSRRESVLPPSSASGNRYETPAPAHRPSAYSKPQDPRPLRSHRFQSEVQDELYNYLSTKKFDIEMKQPLTPKTLKTPTQKEFVLIFQWLYKKLDPGFKFNKSIEQDVYTLLKFLDYPYLDTINKSQISAVGGSNWPVFLGMLHWLLKLVKETLKFDDLDIYSFQEEQSNKTDTNLTDDPVISNEISLMNKLFLTYVLDSYRAFLTTGEDDYSSYFAEMENEYLVYIEEVQSKMNIDEELHETLQQKLDSSKETYNLFFDEMERANALQTDVTKFQNYIDIQKQRQLKWPSVIEKANSDIRNIMESIQNINKEKQDIISDLEKKNLTLKDIEDLHKDRARLTTSLNLIDSKQRQTKQLIESKSEALKLQFNDLQAKINFYNNTVYQILNDLSLETPPDTSSLVINSLDEEYQSTKIGTSPHEMVPILPKLRSSLGDLKNKVQSHITKLQDDILQSQETVDDLKLSIVSCTDKLEELEDSLSKSRKEYSELNDKYTTDSSNKQFDLEEKAKEIRLFKLQNTENRKSIESKWKDAQRDYKKTISMISENRTQLVCDIAQCLDYVVSFKSDVMTDLENTAVEVSQELKQQLDAESQEE
ncbi:hypothetical protein PICMEDRAFT_10390 [Pichia membranifaciens NRRL Y-2026]|uniref:Kinetochore protein NDC80 n=1 Tax=Pichia membranifaciens NRRL Y-2026 TaxID=763406 RepID=A0A1E3NPB9_9ASCO|nr:hypothetical protein PICMEDRAFT_10390 [Pichia membranifaciens NRRL Y-2026]ODQ47393.1 hypothetical protein PICMEDRAFT_10390 [Pichia membranifaciens NRRL Y-2026]